MAITKPANTIDATGRSSEQDGAADKSSYQFTASNQMLITVDSPNLTLGTDDCTILATATADFLVPTPGKRLTVLAGTSVSFGIWQKNGSSQLQAQADTNVVDLGVSIPTTKSPFTVAVKRYNTNQVKAYMNGAPGSDITLPFVNISTAHHVTISANSVTDYWAGSISRNIVFNYALSDDQIKRYSAGAKLDYADIGGSMTDISSALTWANASLTGFTSSANDITAYTAGVNGQYASIGTFSIVAGKRYRVYYTHTGAADVMNLMFRDTSLVTVESTVAFAPNGSGYLDFTATATDTTAKLLFQRNNAGTGSTGALTIVKIVQLGALVDLEPENIGQTSWQDASTNGLHATVNGAKVNSTTGLMPFMFRNAIINGNFDFWQRGTSFPSTLSAPYYGPDRWQVYRSTGAAGATFSRVGSATADAVYCLKMQRDSGNAGLMQIQATTSFETSDNVKRLGRQVTFSVMLKAGANISGPVRLDIWYGTGTDGNIAGGFSGQANLTGVTVNPTSTMTRYSVTAIMPANATQQGVSVMLIPAGTAGADDSVTVCQAQFEVGSVATPFEFRPATVEQALCHRYFQSGFRGVMGNCLGTTAGYVTVPHKVPMRVLPVVDSYFFANAPKTNALYIDGDVATTVTSLGTNLGSTEQSLFPVGSAALGIQKSFRIDTHLIGLSAEI
jgi:hypothetical protein